MIDQTKLDELRRALDKADHNAVAMVIPDESNRSYEISVDLLRNLIRATEVSTIEASTMAEFAFRSGFEQGFRTAVNAMTMPKLSVEAVDVAWEGFVSQ